MAVFNPAGMAPGVYMREEDVPGPIAGVSTGIVAIVGPAQSGPLNTPVFVTNWTQFRETFGEYIYTPLVYAPIAVRGFFDNGGSVCCFVRAGVARQSFLEAGDRSDRKHPVLTITARNEGKQGDKILVSVKDGKLCETEAITCGAAVEGLSNNGSTLVLGSPDEALQFLPGDVIRVSQGDRAEEAEIASVSGASMEIKLKAGLIKTFTTGDPLLPVQVRLADLLNKKCVRFKSSKGLEPGSYLEFRQAGKEPGDDMVEYAVVERLDGNAAFLTAPLSQVFSLSEGEEPVAVRSLEFTLEVIYDDDEDTREVYSNLSVVPYHSRYYEKLTSASKLASIDPADMPNPSLPPFNLPGVCNDVALKGGVDDNPGGLTPQDYFDAIDALKKVQVNIVCVPDAVSFGPADPAVLHYAKNHCESMADRFAILDCGRNLNVEGMLKQRQILEATSYAAIYYPWIEIPHPAGQGRMKVPPSGHIAGVYARTDDLKGVHKAPGNELIRGCLGPATIINDTEHGMLNEVGVNAIMSVPGSGTTLMGARTLSNGTQWRYINVRRLLLNIEKSIQNATRFAVFLPNNTSLWATVKRQVTDFLNGVWRSGALFGATPDDAFRVKIDEELNPPSVRALGQLIIEIVLFPVTPAEYIVFRIIQQPGGPSVSE